MPEHQTTSLQNPTAVEAPAAPEVPSNALEIKTIEDLMLVKPSTTEEWGQLAEDFKAVIARQTEEHRRAAEAINQGVERLLARIAKDRQEYEALKARLGPFEFEKLSAAMAAVTPVVRRKTRRSVSRQTRKKK